MKKLRDRLNIPEVLEFTKHHGRFAAMDKFGVKDYPAFLKFLKEETGDENFGIVTNRPTTDNRPTIIRLMAEYANLSTAFGSLARAQANIKRKKKRIAELEQELFEEELKLAEEKETKGELVWV